MTSLVGIFLQKIKVKIIDKMMFEEFFIFLVARDLPTRPGAKKTSPLSNCTAKFTIESFLVAEVIWPHKSN